MNIFFAVDKNYLPYLYIAINSMLRNSSLADTFNIYVMQTDFTNAEKNALENLKTVKDFNINYVNVDTSLLEKCRKKDYHINLTTFYRYLIPEMVTDIDKAIYLDVDILVKRSLNSLWKIDLEDYYIGAVPDFYFIDDVDNHKNQIGLKDTSVYINAGVLLLNLKKFKEDKISQKLISESIKQQKVFSLGDQDALNVVCEDNIQIISNVYNYQSLYVQLDSVYREEKDNIVIEHFVGADKKLLKNILLLRRFPLKLTFKAILMYCKTFRKILAGNKTAKKIKEIPFIGILLVKIKRKIFS